MLYIISHQGNVTNQNHSEIAPLLNGYYQEKRNKQTKKLEITRTGEDVEKRETLCTVGGNVN